MKRQVGQRLRVQARRRWRVVAAAQWRLLVAMGLAWAAATAGATAFLVLIFNAYTAVWMLGLSTGVLLTFAIVLPELIDPEGRRLRRAKDAECWTADELRRLRRRGWRAVHNLHLQSGDVDHVAVGPGGVVVVETKQSDSNWKYLIAHGLVEPWARQASMNAFKVRHLIKQRTNLDTEPIAAIALWAADAPEEPTECSRAVQLVRGRNIRTLVGSSTSATLSPGQVATIVRALDVDARRFDRAHGIEHDGLIHRLSPLG
jgi:hypothetical protein